MTLPHPINRDIFGYPGDLDPLPALPRVAYPKKVGGEGILVDLLERDVLASSLRHVVRRVEDKLRAEDARLRRLIPPAPDGFEWVRELSYDDEFFGNYAETTVRLRYRLVEVDSRS